MNENCRAELQLGDDFSDNPVTFHCQLGKDHEGLHVETFNSDNGPVTVTWQGDNRIREANHLRELFDEAIITSPSIEEILSWSTDQRNEVLEWLLWLGDEELARPMPNWLKEHFSR